MMGKLRAALLQHGWMEERITDYDWVNCLTVNLEHGGGGESEGAGTQ